jgi:hypothetical protein
MVLLYMIRILNGKDNCCSIISMSSLDDGIASNT